MVGGTGRKKIEIKKKEKKSDRMVTFSKRRKGLFRKATELHTITGSQIAILVFSPASRPFVHGDPDFDSIIDRFLAEYGADSTGNSTTILPGELNCDDSNRSGDSDDVDDSDNCRFDGEDDRIRSLWLESVRVEAFDEEEELLFLKRELEKGMTDIVKEMSNKITESRRVFDF